jgi:pyruvate dehydrogenase E1 component beta subunit
MFVEHKGLYARKGAVDTSVQVPIGQASIARPGRDVTLVSYGSTVVTCLQAAQTLAAEGVESEVIDLRSIQPWDRSTVLASLARTHRMVVVHEAVRDFGVGAEIVATVMEAGFDELDAPVLRVAAPFMPAPFATSLEAGYAVHADAVVQAVRKTL